MSAGDWKDLYKAAQEGDFENLRYHLENGVNPNYQHPEVLSTPLVAAILGGHTDIALFLLKNGADPSLESHFDQLTPMSAAQRMKNLKIIAELSALSPKPPQTFLKGIFKNILNKISKT